jgi:formamidopyrimidine-DNA glycosylase
MPELPEVEGAAVRLRAAIAGRTIAAVQAHHPSQRKRLTSAATRRLVGRTVTAVRRRGKHQLLDLDDGAVVHVHFVMNGDWEFDRATDPLPRFTRVSIVTTDGARVALVDSRALCIVRLHPAGTDPLPTLGPEADDPALTAARLHTALQRRTGPLKPALLDQKLLAGVGNIYAAEACWRARLDPRRTVRSLSLAETSALLKGIRAALADGTRHAGRYRDGSRAQRFKVYDRLDEPCTRCRTPIARITQGQRSTYYCPGCQD